MSSRPSRPKHVSVSPRTISFPRPLNRRIASVLQFVNITDEPIAFKVKTTAPMRYSVKPNLGVLPPQAAIEVQVILEPIMGEPEECKDKFQIETAPLPSGITSAVAEANFATAWAAASEVAKPSVTKLKCQFVEPVEAAAAAPPSLTKLGAAGAGGTPQSVGPPAPVSLDQRSMLAGGGDPEAASNGSLLTAIRQPGVRRSPQTDTLLLPRGTESPVKHAAGVTESLEALRDEKVAADLKWKQAVEANATAVFELEEAAVAAAAEREQLVAELVMARAATEAHEAQLAVSAQRVETERAALPALEAKLRQQHEAQLATLRKRVTSAGGFSPLALLLVALAMFMAGQWAKMAGLESIGAVVAAGVGAAKNVVTGLFAGGAEPEEAVSATGAAAKRVARAAARAAAARVAEGAADVDL